MRLLRHRLRAGPLLAIATILAVTVGTVWAVGAVVTARRAAAADERLQAAVDGARSAALARITAADRHASMLAASPEVQYAFASGDVAALRRLRRGLSDVTFVLGRRTVGGRSREPSVRSTIEVFGSGRQHGAVVVSTTVGTTFLEEERRASTLGLRDLLLVARGGRVAAGPSVGTTLAAKAGRSVVDFTGARYRAVAVPIGADEPAMSIVALSPDPSNPVGAAQDAEVALLMLALTVAALAVFPERLRARRLSAERRRQMPPQSVKTVRSAIALVGDTLAATHNAEALLPVILSAAIEATGAAGGQILEDDHVVSSQADVVGERRAFVTDLGNATGKRVRLVLSPPPNGFAPEAREAAGWFVEQASIALENARLHHLVQRQAVTDELTGLANRRGFMTALAAETSRAERYGTPLVFVLADIDDFKNVNDRYGHHVGDAVLSEFARSLRSAVREIDVPVRLGGEEFGVLLPDTDIVGGTELAERLRNTIAAGAVRANGGYVRVTASFGVAPFVPGTAGDQLLIEADACLYRAKAEGKNRVVSAAAAAPRRSRGGAPS